MTGLDFEMICTTDEFPLLTFIARTMAGIAHHVEQGFTSTLVIITRVANARNGCGPRYVGVFTSTA